MASETTGHAPEATSSTVVERLGVPERTSPEPTVNASEGEPLSTPSTPSKWKALLGRANPAPALQNTGSVARDHLANERTWLAYLRTSLSLASAGVALVQLFTISAGSAGKLRLYVRPLGATVVLIAFGVLLIGAWRYFRIQSALKVGEFPPARRTVGLLSAILVVIVAITFGFLVGVAQ